MQLEPGRLETGFNPLNYHCLGTEDFRIYRSLATGEEYFIDMNDHRHCLNWPNNPGRDHNLWIANNVVSKALAKAMQ